MDTALKTAARAALNKIEIRVDSRDLGTGDAAEYARLRTLRESGLMRPLAARLALLATLGWKRTDIADALDVSRVTLNNWLRDQTRGEATFNPYFTDTAIEGDPDSVASSEVTEPILNKLTPRNAEILGQVQYRHDKFVVPPGFIRPLGALWRVAYKARGHDLTTDADIAAAGDAVDILISLFLRRGVTNLAIAKAAGVTHRAVLDRMNRARSRGLLLNCGRQDDACESFFGEDVIRDLYEGGGDAIAWEASYKPEEWLSSERYLVTPVRITSPRPSRYWLQTMVDCDPDLNSAEPEPVVFNTIKAKVALSTGQTATLPAVFNTMGMPHLLWHTRLHLAQHFCTDDADECITAKSEATLTALLGRMNEQSSASLTIADAMRTRQMFVPAELLYTEIMADAGYVPTTASEAQTHIPTGLWNKYFLPFETVTKCFTDPAEIESEFEPTVKHKADAKTRRENVIA